MPTIDETIAFIRAAHEGQTDKIGTPYWRHPVSVMHRLGPGASDDERHAALLHDIVEDTSYSLDDLKKRGYSANVIEALRLLTKPDGDITYLDWIHAIAASGNPTAIRVKIADNEDNIDPARVAMLPPEKRGGQERYGQSLEILRAALAAAPDQSSRR